MAFNGRFHGIRLTAHSPDRPVSTTDVLLADQANGGIAALSTAVDRTIAVRV